MILARGPCLSARARPSEDPDDIGTPAHERMMMLELANTLEEWPVRNIVVRQRLDLIAREIVRQASVQGHAESLPPNLFSTPLEPRATTPA